MQGCSDVTASGCCLLMTSKEVEVVEGNVGDI